MKYMLQMGADPFILSIHSQSALDLAINQRNKKCVKILNGLRTQKCKNMETLSHCLSSSMTKQQKQRRKSLKLEAEIAAEDLVQNMKSLQLNFESQMSMYKRQKRQSLVISKYNINANILGKQVFLKSKISQNETRATLTRQRHSSFGGYLDGMIKTKHNDIERAGKQQILQNIQQLQANKVRRYSQIGL